MLRFVILKHDHPFPHWDLMLERENVLQTWRLLSEPLPDSVVSAEPLGDHRVFYLDYEGPLTGGRGEVRRWDSGEYSGDIDLAASHPLRLHGTRCVMDAFLQTGDDGLVWRFVARQC